MALSFKSLFGDPGAKIVAQSKDVVAAVGALESTYQALSDEELRKTTHTLRNRLAAGETEQQVLPDAFAAVREGGRVTHSGTASL